MFFNSVEFLVFFAIVYALYLVLTHRWQNLLLLVASYTFYGWWDTRFLMLLVLSTVIDYAAGLGIAGHRLTIRERLKLSIILVGATALFVIPNWPLIQAGRINEPLGTLLEPDWPGGRMAVLVCLAFAVMGPLLYELYFLIRDEERRRKAFLVTSIVANLGILGFFKYFNFFLESAEAALGSLGISRVESLHLDVVLPVGISFYTFQTMSYSLDIYRRQLDPTRRLTDFALYVSFFPQLVAGPIERASRLLPQVLVKREISAENFRHGWYLMCWGMFKKVMIADRAALIVDSVFAKGTNQSGFEMLMGVYAFAWQIYCDFSGYTDIARGLAKVMGFELMVNFRLPYFATNPSEFWRRWHISLSTWLRDYLYIPLGGNKGGTSMLYRNLVITMLLGGLWHGAKWTMILWGAYQGAILVGHRLIVGGGSSVVRGREQRASRLKKVFLILMFFQVTCLGWLIFRAESVGQIGEFLMGMATDMRVTDAGLLMMGKLALLSIPLLCVQVAQYRSDDLLRPTRWSPSVQVLVGAGFAASALAYWVLFDMGGGGPREFIYFQF